jgi:hypothetical protein
MRRRPALPALCAVLLLVVGQLVALAHLADTRHVTCAEHGEEIEAATLSEHIHACGDDHLVGVDSDDDGEHEDCAIARARHQSSATPGMWLPVEDFALAVVDRGGPAQHSAAASAALFRLAPKTSPPALV